MTEELKTFFRFAIVLLFWAAMTLPFYITIIGFRKILETAKRRDQLFRIADTFWRLQSTIAAGLSGAIAAFWCHTPLSPFAVVAASLCGSLGFSAYALQVVLKPAGYEGDVETQPIMGVVFVCTGVVFFAFMYGLVGWIEGFIDPAKSANVFWTVVTSLGVIVGLAVGITTLIVNIRKITKNSDA